MNSSEENVLGDLLKKQAEKVERLYLIDERIKRIKKELKAKIKR